jgi:hypothetical protein
MQAAEHAVTDGTQEGEAAGAPTAGPIAPASSGEFDMSTTGTTTADVSVAPSTIDLPPPANDNSSALRAREERREKVIGLFERSATNKEWDYSAPRRR